MNKEIIRIYGNADGSGFYDSSGFGWGEGNGRGYTWGGGSCNYLDASVSGGHGNGSGFINGKGYGDSGLY